MKIYRNRYRFRHSKSKHDRKVSGAILDCDPDSDPDWDEICFFTVIGGLA